MPMIDVYAAAGTFTDTHRLAADLAAAVMTIEQVPDIPMFRRNTAAFVHELPADSLSNVDGDSTYVRVQVLTNTGALDRDKQLAVVEQLTRIVATAAGDPTLVERTWRRRPRADRRTPVPPVTGRRPMPRESRCHRRTRRRRPHRHLLDGIRRGTDRAGPAPDSVPCRILRQGTG